MHTITSLIATVGAGRQSKSTHTIHIDTADEITGRLGVQSTEDTPVAQSPVQEINVLEDNEAIAHSSASEEGRKVRRLALPAVLKKWKVRAAKKICKEKVPPVLDADAEYMKKLLHLSALHREAFRIAYREENEKARLELKALLNPWHYAFEEYYDAKLRPSYQYIKTARIEEISHNIWEEIFARN